MLSDKQMLKAQGFRNPKLGYYQRKNLKNRTQDELLFQFWGHKRKERIVHIQNTKLIYNQNGKK